MTTDPDRASNSLSPGTLTLIGSGEMTAAMGKVHREVMAKVHGSLHAVFLDTPAGFQLNADDLSARAVDYFRGRLGVELSVVSFKSAATASAETVSAALAALSHANYIFAGPGSPSYAVRQWQASPIGPALRQRFAAGAHVVLASSAAIAASRHVLPVYEIYKVGEEPRWIEGLDLLGPYGIELAIVPHWNNREGGTHDTRYAYMGEPRLRVLEEMLPENAVILGIDEYTACIVDLDHGTCRVMGAGGVTVRQKGRERFFGRGSRFSVDWLSRGLEAQVIDLQHVEHLRATPAPHAKPPAPERPEDLPLHRNDEPLQHMDEPERPSLETPLVDLLVHIRAQLRRDQQWTLADDIRRRLADLGIILEDGREGTSWRKSPDVRAKTGR